MLGRKSWFCYLQQLQALRGVCVWGGEFLNDQEVGTYFLPVLLSFKVTFSSKSLLLQVIF